MAAISVDVGEYRFQFKPKAAAHVMQIEANLMTSGAKALVGGDPYYPHYQANDPSAVLGAYFSAVA